MTLCLLPTHRLSQALCVPGNHVWVMVGRESVGSHCQLCPHGCWVLGMRFPPEPCPQGSCKPTWAGLNLCLEQDWWVLKREVTCQQQPLTVLCHRAPAG